MKKDAEIQILCKNIAMLRKKQGMTQRELASLMGIGVSSLRKLEAGVLPPRLEINAITALARAFPLSPAALFQEL